MKPTVFLLGTLLLAVPNVYGQTAPVAVQVPVAGTSTAVPSNSELQAQIEWAAQALAKLPDATPGLVAAKERVTKAGALVVVPPTYSLGQSSRAAHSVLDNLRSARVWSQSSVKTANATDKVLLNDAIERLQAAETLAQQKVKVLDKPDGRTTEQILADAKRFIEESREFSRKSRELSAASDEALKQSRAESAESMRKFQEAKKAFDALPKPSPVDTQEEKREQEKRKQEFQNFLRTTTPAVTQAERAKDVVSAKLDNASKEWDQAVKRVDALRDRLETQGLTETEQKQIRTQLPVLREQEKQAFQKYLLVAKEWNNVILNAKKAPKTQTQIEELRFEGREHSPTSQHGFILIQENEPDLQALRLAYEAALANQQQADARSQAINDQLNALPSLQNLQNQFRDLFNERSRADREAKSLLQQWEAAHARAEALGELVLQKQQALRAAEANTTSARTALTEAQAALEAAEAAAQAARDALEALNFGECPRPDDLAEAQQALDAAEAAVETAMAGVTTAETSLANAEQAEADAQAGFDAASTDFVNASQEAGQLFRDFEAAQQAERDADTALQTVNGQIAQVNALRTQRDDANAAAITANQQYAAARDAYVDAGGNVDPPQTV